MKLDISELKFNEQGLIPAIIQCFKTKKVLTLCYMNKEALEKTFESGRVYLFRRSKNRLMFKGETSGHIQILKEVSIDCEGKSILLKIDQKVAACHVGYYTCYFRSFNEDGSLRISEKRVFDPEEVY